MNTPPDRLMYAQNWEDPRLELQALAVAPQDRVLAIAGGGCTVLSLLAAAPRQLEAVDMSEAQLRVLELKCATVCALSADEANGFLGGVAHPDRTGSFIMIARHLDDAGRHYWNERKTLAASGILDQGRAENAIALFRRIIRVLIHPRRRIEQLFALDTLEDQARFYQDCWNNRRWRLLFRLLRKGTFDRALDSSFYQHVAPGNLGRQLYLRAETCLTKLPIRENYFLSRMLLGRHLSHPDGRPPYLQPAGVEGVRQNKTRLQLHHRGLLEYLRDEPDNSFDKLYLSNIGEWLAERDRLALFEQVLRVSRPGARICWRALMLDRPLAAKIREQIVVDHQRSAELGRRDRAFLNAAFAVAEVHK